MINNITFFFPYPLISGVPITFANTANYLLRNTKISVNIVDYKNGALIRTCNHHPNLHFIEFKDFKDCYINYETHLVIQASIPYKIRQELKLGSKVRIIQWAAFEYNLVPYLYNVNFLKKIQEKYYLFYLIFWLLNYKNARILSAWVSKMIKRGAIVFMSVEMYNTTSKYLRFNEQIPYTCLPLMSDGRTCYSKNVIKEKSKEIHDCIKVAWVGRIGDFKVHILNYTIKTLSYIAKKNQLNMRFFIVGDGELSHLLQLDFENNFFKITNAGGFEKDEADSYTYENAHIVVGMGTSSIDGARIGLPVILLDQSYKRIDRDYIFRYLHDTDGYDLGHPIKNSDYRAGNNTLEVIIKDILNNYEELSNKSYNYYRINHSTANSAKKLLKFLECEKSYTESEIPSELKRISMMRGLYLWYLENIKKCYYKSNG